MLSTIMSFMSIFFLCLVSALILLNKRSVSNVYFFLVLLLVAAIETVDLLVLYNISNPLLIKNISLFLESFLPLVLLVFSLSYSREKPFKSITAVWVLMMALATIFPVSVIVFRLDAFFYSPDMLIERVLFLGPAGYWFYVGIMIFGVISLVNVEATFAAASGHERWRIKFEAVGMMAIFSVCIFYYSQGLLHRTINLNLMPIRSGVLVLASMFIGYSMLFRANGVKISVSRHVLYKSLTLLIVGAYLLGLGIIEEGMRYFGLSFGHNVAIFMAFAAGMVMLLILFSEQLRRKSKVYINKHFFAHKYDYRERWLEFTRRLSSCQTLTEVQDTILATCTGAFYLEGVSLYLPARGKRIFRISAMQGMPEDKIELHVSERLISYFVERGRVFYCHDYEYVPDEAEASFVRQTGAELIVPLIANEKLEGLLVFGKKLVPEPYMYEDYDLMKTLARQAALSIVNFSLSEELAEAREIAAVARISSFVVHDLKNLATSLSLLLDNAEDYMSDQDFQRATIETIRNTVTKMKGLIHKLKTIPQKQRLNAEPTNLDNLTRGVVEEVSKISSGVEIRYSGEYAVAITDGEELKKVILNLLLNAVDAVNGNGVIGVGTGHHDDMAYIRVEDNGCGIDAKFVKDHLFKPFRTTKKAGLGIGLYQCRQIAETHGGSIEVKSEVGRGSVFTLYLPVQTVQSTI